MTFLYPNMLWGLTALLIPIAVHLFNFRRHKQVYFSNTAVLKTIQQENAKTKRLKHLVVLALRCLFIAALVLAFAFPYKPDEAAEIDTEEGVVGIYLDNTMSMKAQSMETTLLEDARESARNLVSQLPPATRFLLMTNSFEIQNEVPLNQEEMLLQLDRMSLDGRPVKLGEVIDRFEMLRRRHGFQQATLFVYSDFQENMFDLEGVQTDSTLRIMAIPLRAELQANLSVDTVWFDSPVMQAGLSNELHVKITNHGEKPVKGLPVNLTMNGKVSASATVDLEAGSASELAMQFMIQDPGVTRCMVSIVDDLITFDDQYRFVIETQPVLRVVELGTQPGRSSVAMVFDEDPQFDYQRMDPARADLGALSQAHLIVVDEASSLNETLRQGLLDYAEEGASIVIFHDDGKTVDTNSVSVGDLAVRHEFFSDMIVEMPRHADLPRVKQHVRMTPAVRSEVLAYLDNGDPFLMERMLGHGRCFDVATLLDPRWSNLADNALFVPMLLKMALLGGGVGRVTYTLGEDRVLLFSDLEAAGNLDVMVRNEDGSFEIMPAHELRNNRVCVFFQDDLPEAGYYTLSVNDEPRHVLAWNDSRMESEMRFAEPEQITKAFQAAGLDMQAVFRADDFDEHDLMEALARKSTLWRWFVLLALLALVGEVAVLRFWK